MLCPKCGNEVSDDAKFCVKCGASLKTADVEELAEEPKSVEPNTSAEEKVENSEAEEVTSNEEPVSQSSANVENTDSKGGSDAVKPTPKKKSALPKIMIGVVAIALIAVAAFVFLTRTPTIDLDKYLTVEVTGYEGYGQATATIDWEKMEEDYGDKIKFKDTGNTNVNELASYMNPMDVIRYDVYVELDQYSGLSNDDVVNYTWNVSEEIEQYLDVKLKYSDNSITVSDLEEVETFDAFADLEVTFNGVGPNGTVNLNYTGSELYTSYFTVDPAYNLSNGDKVTVSIDEDRIAGLLTEIEKVPAESSKTYTVSGLNTYVSSDKDIDEEKMEALKSQASDVYQSNLNLSEDEDFVSLDYLGYYLLTDKSGDTDTQLILVYKAAVHANATSSEDVVYDQTNSYYWYIDYHDVTYDGDGNLIFDMNDNYYTHPRSMWSSMVKFETGFDSWRDKSSFDYYGYKTLDDLYEDVVTSELENYNHFDHVEE